MAGIARATQQLFCTTGLTPTGGFAGAANGNTATEAGNVNTLSNIQTAQAGAWASGLIAAVLGASKFPAVEDLNAIFNVFSTQIAYILERGIPEYDAGTTYNIGDICRNIGTSLLYRSKINANTGNALSVGADWLLLGDLAQLIGSGYWCGTSGGAANAQTITTGSGLAALTAGQEFDFVAGFTNTNDTTLAIDTVAAIHLKQNSSTGPVVLAANAIIANNSYRAKWDGTNLIINATSTGVLLTANNLSELTATAATARGNISAAKSGANTDITSLSGSALVCTPLGIGAPISASASATKTAGQTIAAASLTPATWQINGSSGGPVASGDTITGTWQALNSYTVAASYQLAMWQRTL